MSKPWWKSRTIWVNIIGTAVGAIAIIGQNIRGEPILDPAVEGAIGIFVLAVINFILRWRTGQALE